MADPKLKYASSAALTLTLASLASDTNLLAGRESTAMDNSSNLYVDALIGGKITTGISPTVDKLIEVWAYGTYEGKVAVALFGDGRKCLLDVCRAIVDRHADRNPDAGSIWSAHFIAPCTCRSGIALLHLASGIRQSTMNNIQITLRPIAGVNALAGDTLSSRLPPTLAALGKGSLSASGPTGVLSIERMPEKQLTRETYCMI